MGGKGDFVDSFFNRWLSSVYELDSMPGTLHLMQSLARGRLDVDDARSLMEHCPRLVAMLIDGLPRGIGVYGFGDFIRAAERGLLTRSVIERAMR